MSIESDKRFEKLFKDPKYKDIPKGVRKVEVSDKRFSHMFTDNKFSSDNFVDEYGKKKKSSKFNTDLEEFYTSNNIILEGKSSLLNRKRNEDDESSSEFSYNENNDNDDDASDDTSILFDQYLQEYADKEENEDDAWDKYKEKDIPLGDATKRLAIMNLNWETINSKDLFVVFTSLSPKANSIKSVAIYPSEFGMKEQEKERKSGPDREIFKDKNKKRENIIINSLDDFAKKSNQNEEGLDQSKLRAYELKRLKYYYAVIQFKSLKISNYIYETYDGMEIERSQMFLDMRFIPDDLEFPYEARDKCNSYPENYEVNIKSNKAMSHSQVELTWDNDDEKRKELLKKASKFQFNDKEIDELIMSSDDEDDLAEALFGDVDENEMDDTIGNIEIIKKKRKTKDRQIKEGEEFDIVFPKGFEGLDKNIKDEKEVDIKDKSLYEQFKERKKVRTKELKMEEKLRREEKKTKREKYKVDNELQLLDDSNCNKVKTNEKLNKNDNRFNAISNNKDYWVDPTSKYYKKKGK